MFKAAARNPWTTAGGIAAAVGIALAMSDAGTIPEWLRRKRQQRSSDRYRVSDRNHWFRWWHHVLNQQADGSAD